MKNSIIQEEMNHKKEIIANQSVEKKHNPVTHIQKNQFENGYNK